MVRSLNYRRWRSSAITGTIRIYGENDLYDFCINILSVLLLLSILGCNRTLLLVGSWEAHVNNTPNTVSSVHIIETLVDVLQSLMMRHKFVDPKLSLEIVVDDTWNFRSTFDTSKCGSFPHSTSDQLESTMSTVLVLVWIGLTVE